MVYHVYNRGNARTDVFQSAEDYAEFLELLCEGQERTRLLAYCLLPSHFHLVVWPREDGELSHWVQWLMTTHVRRYLSRRDASGHVWQGRFKSFPVQPDEHLLSVLRYVERNPIRCRLVRKPQLWPWSSLGQPPSPLEKPTLARGPVPRGADWLGYVTEKEPAADLAALRNCVVRGAPYGSEAWVRRTVKRLGLESTIRPRGRPRKTAK
jgi:putative transposase